MTEQWSALLPQVSSWTETLGGRRVSYNKILKII